jgi:hypothetical protein
VNKFSDNDAVCVAIVLAMCLKTATDRHWIKEWYKRSQGYKQESLMTDLILSEPNDFIIFFCQSTT